MKFRECHRKPLLLLLVSVIVVTTAAIWVVVRPSVPAGSRKEIRYDDLTRAKQTVSHRQTTRIGISGLVNERSASICATCAAANCGDVWRSCAKPDENGRFYIKAPSVPLTVFASAAGYVTQQRDVSRAPAENVDFNLQSGGEMITGRLVDRRGSPVIGAIVEVATGGIQLAGLSEENGQFTATIPRGPAILVVRSSGHGLVTIAAQAPSDLGVVTLGDESRLEGRVLLEGSAAAVPNIDVYIRSERDLLASPHASKTDLQGRFEFDGLAGGPHTLIASSDGVVSGRLDLTIDEGKTVSDVVLELKTGVSVSGKVTIARTGMPCPSASVRLAGGPSGAVDGISSSGSVTFAAVPPGLYHVQIQCSGYRPIGRQVQVFVDSNRRAFEWLVEDAFKIVGKVEFAGKRSNRHVWLEATRERGESRGQAIEESGDGSFVISDLAAGDYVVSARNAERGPMLAEPQRCSLSEQSPSTTLNFFINPTAAVEASCGRSETFEPGFSIFARDEVGNVSFASAEDDMKYLIRDLPTGRYAFYTSDDRNAPRKLMGAQGDGIHDVKAGQILRIPCTVPLATGFIRGKVIDDLGRPVNDAWIMVRSSTEDPLVSNWSAGVNIATQPDGSFAIDKLRDSVYQVEARRGAVRSARTVNAGETLRLVLPRPSSLRVNLLASTKVTTELSVRLKYSAVTDTVERRYFPPASRVDLSQVAPGLVELELSAGGRTISMPVELAPAEERELTVVMPL